MMKGFTVLIALLLLAGCSSPQKPPRSHLVSTTLPTVKDVPIYLDYMGNMTANKSVSVRSQVSGELMAQYFVEGQKVKQGDLLLVIDPRPYQADLAQTKAALDQSLATLHYDKETQARYSPLAKQEYVSKLNFDQYVTNVLVDEAILAQNQAKIETAQINLGYCFIEAPMDCVTGKLFVKPGNYVDAGANTKLTLLNQIQPILVDFYIPETDLLTIQEKQQKSSLQLKIYPDPSHHKGFDGTLTLINNQVDTATGSLLLEGMLANEESLLWPGQFVDVRLILEEKKDALLIPNESVMIGEKGHYVYVVSEDSVVSVKQVKASLRYKDGLTLIESGLKPQDEVVTKGQLNLYPGMKVEVRR